MARGLPQFRCLSFCFLPSSGRLVRSSNSFWRKNWYLVSRVREQWDIPISISPLARKYQDMNRTWFWSGFFHFSTNSNSHNIIHLISDKRLSCYGMGVVNNAYVILNTVCKSKPLSEFARGVCGTCLGGKSWTLPISKQNRTWCWVPFSVDFFKWLKHKSSVRFFKFFLFPFCCTLMRNCDCLRGWGWVLSQYLELANEMLTLEGKKYREMWFWFWKTTFGDLELESVSEVWPLPFPSHAQILRSYSQTADSIDMFAFALLHQRLLSIIYRTLFLGIIIIEFAC